MTTPDSPMLPSFTDITDGEVQAELHDEAFLNDALVHATGIQYYDQASNSPEFFQFLADYVALDVDITGREVEAATNDTIMQTDPSPNSFEIQGDNDGYSLHPQLSSDMDSLSSTSESSAGDLERTPSPCTVNTRDLQRMLTPDPADRSTYRIQYVPPNTYIKCRGLNPCRSQDHIIGPGELVHGSLAHFGKMDRAEYQYSWRHWGCVTPQIIKNWKKYSNEDPGEIDGWKELDEIHKDKFLYAWDNGKVDDEDLTPCLIDPMAPCSVVVPITDSVRRLYV
ncbi:hypothetical protein M422DRAFT_68379 [Sphaerobolus stellatus SS14]|uniref:PARP-type domain-containing protein n=1 Tax=Sphaerobolus stellatus (strain SS14) TaxID=990650 RepID=A0A0C9VRU3_SPHS4|nr:hypothetical protein M422DRAFT_68379 [Sphaerobolus stellatus SS14]